MLETTQHQASSFITLTYDDDGIPRTRDGLMDLEPVDLQKWLKRLRKNTPQKLRYYAVGEYGDETQRPHYHLALFGFAPCQRGRTRKDYLWEKRSCCEQCDTVHHTWGHGGIDVAHITDSSARYIAGYIEKKLTHADDPRLQGRHPEFNRMSRHNGGIGFAAMHDVASVLLQYDLHKKNPDVPVALLNGKSTHRPLGKYLRKQLRMMVGKDASLPPEILAEYEAEVRAMYQVIWNSSARERGHKTVKQAFKEALIEKNLGLVQSLLVKSSIRKQRKSL